MLDVIKDDKPQYDHLCEVGFLIVVNDVEKIIFVHIVYFS